MLLRTDAAGKIENSATRPTNESWSRLQRESPQAWRRKSCKAWPERYSSNELRTPAEDEYVLAGKAIHESRWICELEENWDDEGSTPYAGDFWRRAAQLASDISNVSNRMKGVLIGVPTISPAHSGSIDISWRTDKHRLLVNLTPKSPFLTWYGRRGEGEFKGAIEVDAAADVLSGWLASGNPR